MITKCYSVFDVKSAAYVQPFFLVNDQVAVRAVSDLLRDRNHSVAQHPADYRLVCIGEFEDSTGELIPCNPRVVCELAALVVGELEA